ncbi:sensor histidine kinase [Acidaminobacter sp.]|uniref:sensor histidine kinase n=1 Tax=Acidaminobacter sp. TaxID=1872102 RepID=UPI00137FAB8D|nr:ATP-binding protein [Acidaminobacter sp.]MDK9711294.1 ATP-binding protein [Acidaminobacter sp.]MZQ97101.1 sensor histidine kinase [Acidaminobacter sp.]
MKLLKPYILAAALVAAASQIGLSVLNADFRISAGIIVLALILNWDQPLKPIRLGIISGLSVYALRLCIHALSYGSIQEVWLSYQFEILFYLFYGIIYQVLSRWLGSDHLNRLAIVLFISDLGANLIEIFSRILFSSSPYDAEITITLLFVALIRSLMIWIVLNGLRYYKILLLKEEHEVRYARLVWLTAQLKSEMYWMEKNMEEIEKVMTNAYTLFEDIKFDHRREGWGEKAVTIARDVHEIKKEYELAVRGIKELTADAVVVGGMSFKDICKILYDSMVREIREMACRIELEFESGESFYTVKHYFLMSILRNLMMNSIDAIEADTKEGKIKMVHDADQDQHYFIVTDTGPGIEPEDLDQIFTPGFSTKINYATGHINRGLGLSVVQNIVEKELCGTIEAESVKGKGTTFRITIPKAVLEASL